MQEFFSRNNYSTYKHSKRKRDISFGKVLSNKNAQEKNDT